MRKPTKHPQLLPLDEIDPDAGTVLPLCRELPLPRAGWHAEWGSGFILTWGGA